MTPPVLLSHRDGGPVVSTLVAAMLRGRLDNVLTYFDHRVTRATCEGMNNRIQAI